MASTLRYILSCSAASVAVFAAQPSLSQAVSQDGKDATTDNGTALKTQDSPTSDIIVTGSRQFLSVDTSGTTGLPLPIEKVPQSISIVSNAFLRAADLKTIGQVADYTPGAAYEGTPGLKADRIKLRGLVAGNAVDGLNVDESFNPDYATIERLEIVKGPSSVIYGVSNPGGIINRVTKGAGSDTPSYISVQAGSYDDYRLEGQIAQPLDADGRFRAIGIGAVETSHSFQDVLESKNYVLYGGINANLGDVTGFVHAGYEYHKRTSFDGIPTEADGSEAPVSKSFSIASRNAFLKSNVGYANTGVTWNASDMLQFNLKGLVEKSKLSGAAPYAAGLQEDGSASLAVETYLPTHRDSYDGGINALYKLDNFGLSGSFITVAALYQVDKVDIKLGEYSFADGGNINIFDGVNSITNEIDSGVPSGIETHIHTLQKVLTLTTQSVIKPISKIEILFGASYSKANITNGQTDYVAGVVTNDDYHPKGQMSYRAGLTYEFLKGANAYFSYSQSFLPQLHVDGNGNVLPALSGDQYEVGVKYAALRGKLLLSAAGYKIKQKNAAQYDDTVNGVDIYAALGQVTHKGVEIAALGQITKSLQINAGYSYLDPKVDKDEDASIVGKTRTYLPKNTYSVFATYTFRDSRLKGLALGSGVRYVSHELTSYDGSTGPLPGYTVFDASIGYSFRKWQIQLNMKNLSDKKYYINNYDTLYYGNTVGTPRSVLATVSRSF